MKINVAKYNIKSIFLPVVFLTALLCFCAQTISMQGLTVRAAPLTAAVEYWDGDITESFDGGDGTQGNPFQISTGGQLAFFAREVNEKNNAYNSPGVHFSLTSDIYLNDTSGWETWKPENPGDLNIWPVIGDGDEGQAFRAVFLGNGYCVRGLYINSNLTSMGGRGRGLFGYVNGGKIYNLGIEESLVSGWSTLGGIAGKIYGTGAIISHCYNKGNITGGESAVGGIAGWADGGAGIINSYNTGEVKGSGNTGGIAGMVWDGSYVSNCYSTGNVTGTNSTIGGIVGFVSTKSSVLNCYVTGSVSGPKKTGGIAGVNGLNCEVSFCYFIKTEALNAGLPSLGVAEGLYEYISDFNAAAELTVPVTVDGIQYSTLSRALDAWIINENINGGHYSAWISSPYPSFQKMPVPENMPDVLSAVYGDTLSAISLSGFNGDEGRWSWENPTQSVGTIGNKNFPAVYTPLDTAEYYAFSMELIINVTPKELTNELQPVVGTFIYDKTEHKPIPEVTGLTLEDYDISYINNTNAGTATVEITGKGNYSGNLSADFIITPKALTDELAAVSGTFFGNGSEHTPSAIVRDLVLNRDYTVRYSDNINPGIATLTITGIGNYCGELSTTFTIDKVDTGGLSGIEIALICAGAVLIAAIIAAASIIVFLCLRRKKADTITDSLDIAGNHIIPESAVSVNTAVPEKPAVSDNNHNGLRPLADCLSDRELEIARHILQGKLIKEIAESMHLAERTIKFHMANIYKKTDCKSKNEFMIKYRNK